MECESIVINYFEENPNQWDGRIREIGRRYGVTVLGHRDSGRTTLYFGRQSVESTDIREMLGDIEICELDGVPCMEREVKAVTVS
ncbi:hypothetical protein CMI47_16350 [Candidatus Pacearchaeota archaeon]|nr:hypothetical protein [Candidatus Pacearchaeota archaeon]|tara:strand:- start:221 stop:475 length:255 start_codon:yes stop_codon:yes gene_type:complete